MKRSMFLAMATFALVACEGETAEADTSPASEAAIASSETQSPSAPEAAEGRAIPVGFLGVWDYVEGSCDPASDLRMEVEPRRIVFYESVGDVIGMRIEGDDAIVVTMTMSGEGDTWQEETRLTLENGGDRLIPTSAGDEDAYEPMPRKKCAA